MNTRNPLANHLLDEDRSGLTFKDIKAMNLIYNCQSRCPVGSPPCENGGYRIPYGKRETRGDECPCICPMGYKGDLCEQVLYDQNKEQYGLEYYGGLRCGGNITKETQIRTPGYPQRLPTKPGCAWSIQPPPGFFVSLDIIDFDFRPRDSKGQYKDLCLYEQIQVRRDRNINYPDM